MYLRQFDSSWSAVLRQLAEYIGSKPEDVVFVENASHGVNAVLRSLADKLIGDGKALLYLDTAYQMVGQ